MDTSKPPFEGGGFGNSVIDNFPECAFLVVSRSELIVPPISHFTYYVQREHWKGASKKRYSPLTLGLREARSNI